MMQRRTLNRQPPLPHGEGESEMRYVDSAVPQTLKGLAKLRPVKGLSDIESNLDRVRPTFKTAG
jgi:hypothetical protein